MNYEKEEAWLNSMSSKGLAFRDYFLCRYIFEDSDPGKYIYRIELLDKHPGEAEGQRYLEFMEENGVECISSWYRWVYFRKEAGGGGFDIYSDADSQLAHYRRISTLWLIVIILAVLNGSNMLIQSYNQDWTTDLWSIACLVLCISLLCVGAAIFVNWNSLRKKMKVLKREKNLRG